MSFKEQFHIALTRNETVIFDFHGIVTQDTIVSLARALESTLLASGEAEPKVRTIFEILVEVMQNILSYSSDSKELSQSSFESQGSIVITIDDSRKLYKIYAANHIHAGTQDTLLEQLQEANSVPFEAIKEYYKTRRRNRDGVHARGAGLGFLDIIRKSKNPLKYDFKPTSDEVMRLFELVITIA